MPTVPLRYRLPNPPARFVGRRREAAQLAAAIERASVAVVTGPGGIGKTALVGHVIARRFAARLDSVVYVDLRADAAADRIDLEVALALVAARGGARVDWASVGRDADALDATVLDLAETGEAWLVIDDAHHADPQELASFLERAARYARRSRWIVVTRHAPSSPALAGQIVTLGPMSDGELAQLARAVAPSTTGALVEDAVAYAAGSPWRCLRKLLDPAGVEDAVGSLPADALALLRALALIEAPLPLEVLRALGGGSDEPLAELTRRGWIHQGGGGARLHDAARGSVRVPDEVRPRVAEALAQRTEPTAALEAIRLSAACGAGDALSAVVRRHADEIFAAGLVHRLWRLLEPISDERLATIRLRCAVELGDRKAVRRAISPAVEDHLLVARALLIDERFADTLAAIDRAPAADPRTRFELEIVRARAIAMQRRFADALAALERADAPDAAAFTRREAFRAQLEANVERFDDAERRLAAALGGLDSLPDAERAQVAGWLAGTMLVLGRLAEGTELLERAAAPSPLFHHGRVFLMNRVYAAMLRGALDEARALSTRLEPYLAGAVWHRLYLAGVDVEVMLAAGDLGSLDELLPVADAEAASAGLELERDVLASVRERLATLRAEPMTDAPPLSSLRPDHYVSRMHRMWWLIHAARAGRPPSDEELAVLCRERDQPWTDSVARLLAAHVALARGDVPGAIAAACASIERARRHGYGIVLAEALHVKCEALLVDRAPALAAAEELAAHAASMPSPRFALEARLVLALARREPAFAELEAIAAAEGTAPIAARRAQALLGAAPRLDAIDRTLLAAATLRPITLVVDGRAPGWGLDLARSIVWLPEREATVASAPVLRQILLTLAERRGEATREQLASTLWPDEEYHRLRHGNRLQVAVRKLRELVEDDPSDPKRILTSPDGYALAGPFRLAR